MIPSVVLGVAFKTGGGVPPGHFLAKIQIYVSTDYPLNMKKSMRTMSMRLYDIREQIVQLFY